MVWVRSSLIAALNPSMKDASRLHERMLPSSANPSLLIKLRILAARHIEVEMRLALIQYAQFQCAVASPWFKRFRIGGEIVAAELFRQLAALAPCNVRNRAARDFQYRILAKRLTQCIQYRSQDASFNLASL